VTIDDVLRARAGEKLRVSVFPISSGYQASVSDDGKGWRVEMAATPDIALKKALGMLPGASGELWSPPAAAPATGSAFE
jgi:hypothetical protein